MRNWSVDIKNLSKYPVKYKKFVLESLINFGTGGKKINKSVLRSEIENLSIDPQKKKYLKMLIS